MDAFSAFGVAAFCIAVCMLGFPGRVKKLERKIRKREHEEEGGGAMSELLKQLEGTKCKIRLASGAQLPGDCLVLAVDEDWIKVRITNKKGIDTTKLLRTEDLAEVTCL